MNVTIFCCATETSEWDWGCGSQYTKRAHGFV
jgi:hypothetical protein